MDMKTLLEHMQAHHGRCDQLYADGENFLLDEQIEEGLDSIKSFQTKWKGIFRWKKPCSFLPSKKSAVCVRGEPR